MRLVRSAIFAACDIQFRLLTRLHFDKAHALHQTAVRQLLAGADIDDFHEFFVTEPLIDGQLDAV